MKIKIHTLGCKVNQYESQAIAEQFNSLGYQQTSQAADLYIINTCTVTKTADQKVKKIIARVKKENPNAKIAASGCLAEANSTFLKKLNVDWIIPQKNKYNLVKIVLGSSEKKIAPRDIWSLQIRGFNRKRAFVKIQDGCNLFCSFCKIPYLRPTPSSQKKEKIIQEIKRLSLKHQEIVLCGVNLALYGRDQTPKTKLSELCEKLLKLKSLGRLRLSSLQPLYIDDKLISLIKHPKMCSHFHLSFQYGEDRILKAMNKKERVEFYLKIVEKIRKVSPQAAISCDIMIGFPGEDEKSFDATVDFLKKIQPMRTHIFTFSPREKTPFAGYPPLKKNILKKRYVFLNKLTNDFSLKYSQSFLNKNLKIIAEEQKAGFTVGYTENYIKVNLKEQLEPGCLAKIKITEINKNNKVFAQLI